MNEKYETMVGKTKELLKKYKECEKENKEYKEIIEKEKDVNILDYPYDNKEYIELKEKYDVINEKV